MPAEDVRAGPFPVLPPGAVSTIGAVPELVVDGKRIADDADAYVVAEIGHNHQGDVGKARALIHAAKQCGVDAVKFQKRENRVLGEAARSKAEERFSWEVTTQATIAAYRTAAMSGGTSG